MPKTRTAGTAARGRPCGWYDSWFPRPRTGASYSVVSLQLRALGIGGVEFHCQARVRVADLVDDGLGPVEILVLAEQRPVRRRARDDVAEIAQLVGDLELLGGLARLGRAVELVPLALGLREALVVGDLGHDSGDARAKELVQLVQRGR